MSYSKKDIFKVIKKCKNTKDFRENYRDYYLSALRNGYLKEISKILPKAGRIWTRDKILKIAIKCKNKKEFRVKHQSAYRASIKLGLLNTIDEFLPKTSLKNNGQKKN